MDVARHEDRRRGVRPPMYRVTGHYPEPVPADRGPDDDVALNGDAAISAPRRRLRRRFWLADIRSNFRYSRDSTGRDVAAL